MRTVFLRAIEADDKATALLAAIRAPEVARSTQRFEVDLASFALVPGAPFAYWVREQVRRLFVDHESLEAAGRIARRTNGTTDDNRWIRAAWETPLHSERDERTWVPHAKGGAFSTYYSDVHLAIHWDRSRLTYPGYLGTFHRPDVRPASVQHFFRPGLTWPRRTNGLSFRTIPSGCIFGDKGPAVFVSGDAPDTLLALCATLNSAGYRALVALQLARTELAQSFEAGLIQQTPVPTLTVEEQSVLSSLARRAWSLKRSVDTHTETSHAFSVPALLQATGDTLTERTAAWADSVCGVQAELSTIQAEIDKRCFDLYGLEEADRRAMTDGFGSTSTGASEDSDADTDGEAESESDEAEDITADATRLTAELVSWAVGAALGRFDVRLATGDRPMPAEPEPFDPLLVCSPAMLTADDGLPLNAAPPGYPLTLPESGLLVDDPGHGRDISAAVRAVFDVVFGTDADARWHEAAALLDLKDGDLRTWFGQDFFDHHLKRYSKSRRKAPIIWQLATPSSSYSVWLYAHRLTKDSFLQVQNDLVGQKLAHEERKHLGLVQAAGPSPSANQRKEIAAQETLVEELRAMLDEVKRIAPLWRPDLDDGIVLTMAPLWRLVPQHKSWQKELKAAWDALCAGTYDWAHLAMHLWPERVVPKCATDRSLAIAHGLEDVFWVESADGKWTPRSTPMRPTDDLVRERSSPAVKAALKTLLEAPTTNAGGGRGRSRRAAKVGANGGER